MSLVDTFPKIELILSDVDGVMTDGRIRLADDGQQTMVFHIRDDLWDLASIRAVGLGVAVADAVEDVRRAAKYTTSVRGGDGAVREVVELILKNTGRWDETVARYGG